MIFRTGNSVSKRIVYAQIAALLMMLVGLWHLGLVFFIIASLMSLKQMNRIQSSPAPPQRCIIAEEDVSDSLEAAEQEVAKEQEKRQKALEKEKRKAERAKWQAVVEASVLTTQESMKEVDIPNGFVVRGPTEKPVLVDFDKDGKLVSKGLEVEMGSWLKSLGEEGIPEDVVVLVHSIKGNDQILIKSLEVNRITKDGEKISVKEAARLNLLPQVVESLREKYIERMQNREVENILEATLEKDNS